MSKYYIRGDYTIHKTISKKMSQAIKVSIPFISGNDFLLHGIGHALSVLKQHGIYPSEDGFDILALASLVYLADTRISRIRHAEDSWTREFSIELPVFNLKKWASASEIFTKMLNFLTGDRWEISFTQRDKVLSENNLIAAEYDVVSLFSGGMDSLIGTINHLESNHSIALISHAGDSYTKNAQQKLLTKLKNKYHDLTLSYFNLWMVFEKNLIPGGEIENSTRSRSFLFIAFGIFTLSSMNRKTVLQVPENGLIALNVPLDDLRIGSHSTRTTHPFYMNLWNQALSELDLPYSIENPYWNKTKGEMAVECLNKDFLLQAIKESTSCASPQKARWSGHPSQHCGYCVPCLIRRAAMHKAYDLENDTTTYMEKSISKIISAHAKGKGEQLRSFQIAIKRIKDNPKLKNTLIYKNGRLDGDDKYINHLADVYYRGLLEVDNFINAYLRYEKNRP
jgi:7-cyano-7-deazaguanine synthase in queuosine biosynthesis